MITIIHGEDQQASRNYYLDLKKKAKNPLTLDGPNLNSSDLVQTFEGSALFAEEKNVFIENFFGGRKANSTEFKTLLSYIVNHSKSFNVYFWEGKEVQKTIVSNIKNAEIKLFDVPKTLFPFLDSLKPGNQKQMIEYFHNALNSTEAELLFFMLVRQFRLMLSVLNSSNSSIDEAKRLAPWQKGKLERQARLFTEESLKKNYTKLFALELSQKTGGSPASLAAEIDFFLLSL